MTIEYIVWPMGPAWPAGSTWDTGVQGDVWPKGDAWVKGDPWTTGPEGPAGPTGPKWDVWVKGDQGEIGPQGPQWVQGSQWIQGERWLTWLQGPQWPTGATWPAGPQWVKGDKGDQWEVGPMWPWWWATWPAGPAWPPGPASDISTLSETTHIQNNRVKYYTMTCEPQVGGSTHVANGAIFTITGSTTSGDINMFNDFGVARRVNYQAATASTSAVCGLRIPKISVYRWGGPSIGMQPYGGFYMSFHFWQTTGQASNATRRMFIGMQSNLWAPTNADVFTAWKALIGVWANEADVNLQWMHSSWSSLTKVDTWIPKAMADGTKHYEVIIYSDPDSEQMFMRVVDHTEFSGVTNLVYNYTASSNIPNSNVWLTFNSYMAVGSTSSVVGMANMGLYIEALR